MKRTFFLLGAILLNFCSIAQQNPKPNILFIAVDDLKPLLNCYGAKHMKTPNIDRLAKMGTIFINNYCQQAVCAPSRASIMTGQRPDYTRIWDLKTQMRDMNPTILTMPQHFKQQGYATTGIGKVYDTRAVDKQFDAPSWSIPYDRPQPSDYAEGYPRPLNNHYQSAEARKLIAKIQEEAKNKGLEGAALADYLNKNRGPAFEYADVPDNAYIDGAIVKRAVNTLGNLSKANQPFFMAVGISKPHLPFCAPKKYWDMYDHNSIKLSDFQQLSKNAPEFAFQPSSELVNNYVLPTGERYGTGYAPKTEAQQRDLIHGYYAAVSYTDALIGKLLDALQANNIDKNTIVVLWGDHGWHLGDHGIWCKHTNFEQATRAPLIIVAPQYKGNQQTASMSEFVDVFPTLTDLTGVATPDGLAGKSLVPILKNPKASVKPYSQSQYPRQQGKKDLMGYAIRTARYRYVAWFEEDFQKNKVLPTAKPVAVELYDYQKDPNETENVSSKADYQKVVKEHEAMMTSFLTNQRHSR